jgi:hypothetical protein
VFSAEQIVALLGAGTERVLRELLDSGFLLAEEQSYRLLPLIRLIVRRLAGPNLPAPRRVTADCSVGVLTPTAVQGLEIKDG